VRLSHERLDIAGAEGFYSLEGNTCGTAMRGAVALPGSKATSRANGSPAGGARQLASLPRLRRREFITLLGGAAVAWPLAARAQQSAMPIVGFVTGRSPEGSARLRAAFRKGLNEIGYVEGQNVMVEYHWLEAQYDRLPSLIADLVGRRVAVIATLVNPAAFAAKAATTTIPIVFLVSEDPVRLGLVASLARPGGNMTGVNVLFGEVVAKRLELLHDLVPKAARVGVLVNPANASITEATLRDIPEAARAIGLQLQVLNASTSREIDAAFATLVRERADALFVTTDALFISRRVQLATLAARHAGSRDLFLSRGCGSRWTDELRDGYSRHVSSSRRLRRPHPQGRETC
jgi:putative tryptophan/tyrosine transport system substrate-binding protein